MALAAAEGRVAELEGKLSVMEKQLLVAGAEEEKHVAVAGAEAEKHAATVARLEAELAGASAQVVSLSSSASGDGVALAAAEGRVAELEGKMSVMEKQLLVAGAEAEKHVAVAEPMVDS